MHLSRVYITVGTTKFDALISSISSDSALKALEKRKCTKLVIQHGNSQPLTEEKILDIRKSHGIYIEQYKFRPNIEDIKSADLIIGHAGAGTCMDILNNRKHGLIVINDTLMDNHQLELAKQLSSENYLYYCKVTDLDAQLASLDFKALKPYEYQPENLNKFVSAINELMSH
ncbi:UDP-N-acetylglucosamine transferase subunit ALG13 homolog [Drosophila eugracilis]|uniref:UDP-N-acetylglucosamine transferase subunit ALG13 homolog n=1 Tax=Drosophila eugracilis TaxID=29029 RepID=UPI0007E82302|nr:UDP-N-acetylglucosamine transferase subunit ALG13 homolog [Drosophila eugracilis]